MFPQFTLIRELELVPPEEEVEGTLCWIADVTLVDSVVLATVGLRGDAGLFRPSSREIGTSGGMSLGAGARNPDLGLSLLSELDLGDARSFFWWSAALLGRDLDLSSPWLDLGESGVFLASLSFPSFLSIGGMIGFEGFVSLPMLLHV